MASSRDVVRLALAPHRTGSRRDVGAGRMRRVPFQHRLTSSRDLMGSKHLKHCITLLRDAHDQVRASLSTTSKPASVSHAGLVTVPTTRVADQGVPHGELGLVVAFDLRSLGMYPQVKCGAASVY